MVLKIAIIGRPNVGKSTLYNRLTGTNHALVDDLPGVTRDRREGEARIGDIGFKIIDTAGLENATGASLEKRMFLQTEYAVEEADVVFFMVDGRAGVTPLDSHFAKWLRSKHEQIILVINKCEGSKGDVGIAESMKLGFKLMVAISAEHNEGMADLYRALKGLTKVVGDEVVLKKPAKDKKKIDESEEILQIAIVGRPNSGKSTLLNMLIGKERVLTGPEAGITRDAIAVDWEYQGRKLRLIDTAGIRRKSKVEGKLERLSVNDSVRAINFAKIVVLMIDATMPLEKQDLSVADQVISEGRAIVVAANKWDLIKNKKAALEEIKYKLDKLLPDIRGVPVVTISALTGDNVNSVVKACFDIFKIWNKRVTTTKLNNWLKFAEETHTAPLGTNNRRVKLKYITQGKRRPPTFMLFVNKPSDVTDNYKRYLINSIRENFKLPGVPIRLLVRGSKNPFVNE